MAAPAISGEPLKNNLRPKVVAAVSLALVVGLLGLIIFSHRALSRIYHLSQERARLLQENASLAEENLRLARTVDRLHHDPEMIQDLIRRELNFVKKNEIIIQLLEKDQNASLRAATAPHHPPPEIPKGTKASHLREPVPMTPSPRARTP